MQYRMENGKLKGACVMKEECDKANIINRISIYAKPLAKILHFQKELGCVDGKCAQEFGVCCVQVTMKLFHN